MNNTPRTHAAWKEVLQDAMDEIVNMAKENYELKERIKRLERGGDEAIDHLDHLGRVRIWTEAKEAKP